VWKPIAAQSAEPDQFVVSLIGDTTIRVLYPRNQNTFTIQPDGKEYPGTGPASWPGTTTLSEAIDSRSVRRTTLRDHKALFETVMTVSPDGKRLTVTSRTFGATEAPAVFVYNKQD
jgi:hypothetical protein